MGRIQKKKSSAAKKKQKQATAGQSTAGAPDEKKSGISKVALSAGAAKAPAKKQAPPKRQSAAASQPAAKPKDNIFTKTAQFLREVKVELKKVTWPTRKQTIGSTAVVIALVMLISLFLGVVDFGISGLIRIVLQ
ncbi:preprotein translocase subunit SecE [Thermodesulfobacteriota bacterium]